MKKNIAIFVYDDIEILDFTGPYEIFSIADELRSGNLFNLFLVSENKSRLIARNHFKFEADYQFYNHPKIDYFLIPGGPGARVQENNDNVLNWIELQFF